MAGTNGTAEATKVVVVEKVVEKVAETGLTVPGDFMPPDVTISPELFPVAKAIQLATVLLTHLCFHEDTPKADKLSPRARKVKSFIEKSDFNCRSATVAGLMSLLLDEKIEVREKDADKYISWVVGAVYVPVETGNDHNYPLGEPFVCVEHQRGIRVDGRLGNTCSSYLRCFRKVTMEDMVKVFSSEKILTKVSESIIIGGH